MLRKRIGLAAKAALKVTWRWGPDLAVGAVVDRSWRVQRDVRVVVDVVVVAEELDAELPGLLDCVEALGELRAVLDRLELRLGERVVVAHVWAAVGPNPRPGRRAG